MFYCCDHSIRFENTQEDTKLLSLKPNKRFRKTNCPFQMSFKVLKPKLSEKYPCEIAIVHDHNHPFDSL